MSSFTVVSRDGANLSIDGQNGRSLMEHIREAGLDEMLALCGGCCSCATCHVYIEPRFLALLPPMSQDEDELLDGSEHRLSNSRLSCQIPFHDHLDTIVVRIAPDE